MIKIEILPKVVAGTDRGGEDLYIVFRGVMDQKPDESLIKKMFSPDQKGNPKGIKVIPIDGYHSWRELSRIDDDGAINVKSKLLVVTGFYEIEWKSSGKKAFELCQEFMLDMGNWNMSLKDERFHFKHEMFVGGNAE